MRTRVGTYMKP